MAKSLTGMPMMSMPDLISIDPLEVLPSADVVVPGSKSITNRALILAAQAEGEICLEGALWSEDTQVMVDCLKRIGYRIEVSEGSGDPSNRRIKIQGQGARIPGGGSGRAPLELFVGNAGTAARFLMAFLCLGSGCYRLVGVERMHERPQRGLISALRELGYRIETENDRLPAVVYGGGPKQASCSVEMGNSSQFASALLLVASLGGWQIQGPEDLQVAAPYVWMTAQMVRRFREGLSSFTIEPDASSGSYFWALNGLGFPSEKGVRVQHWPQSGWQIDAQFPHLMEGAESVSRERDLGDSIMTAIVLASVGSEPRQFTDLGRLRLQECERVVALRTELQRCGVSVSEEGDTLRVQPGRVEPATIETYQDHRMAMCFAVLALKAGGLRIKDPNCVRKTFPNFFQKLAMPAPHGVGAVIRDGRTGAPLLSEDLVAQG